MECKKNARTSFLFERKFSGFFWTFSALVLKIQSSCEMPKGETTSLALYRWQLLFALLLFAIETTVKLGNNEQLGTGHFCSL